MNEKDFRELNEYSERVHGRRTAPYWSPYLGGFFLGIVLLLSFVLMGRGIGASGALTRLTGYALHEVAPEHADRLTYFRPLLNEESHILNEYLVFMLAGVLVGGFVSGALGGRVRFMVDRGPTFSPRKRLILAFVGGGLAGWATRLARGCTSGQALTGGATLAVGSWVFIVGAFLGGYAVAYFVRRQWQ